MSFSLKWCNYRVKNISVTVTVVGQLSKVSKGQLKSRTKCCMRATEPNMTPS